MSKPLFEFVKVAAGEPFPFETGYYSASFSGPDPNDLQRVKFGKGNIADQFIYILRPAESPDAGREAWINAKQCPPPKVQWRHVDGIGGGINYWYDVVLNAYRIDNIEWRLLPSELDPRPTPATNVGDIPAGREEFIEKVCGFVVDTMMLPPGKREKNLSVADFMRAHWPTPADPGSQVEAVDPVNLLEWVLENFAACGSVEKPWVEFGPLEQHQKRQLTTPDLIQLYQKSLNEKK